MTIRKQRQGINRSVGPIHTQVQMRRRSAGISRVSHISKNSIGSDRSSYAKPIGKPRQMSVVINASSTSQDGHGIAADPRIPNANHNSIRS